MSGVAKHIYIHMDGIFMLITRVAVAPFYIYLVPSLSTHGPLCECETTFSSHLIDGGTLPVTNSTHALSVGSLLSYTRRVLFRDLLHMLTR
jgi:hypothetical protein